MIILKSDYNLDFRPSLNKNLFGLGTAIMFFSFNYVLFDRNERYKGLLDKYNHIQNTERLFHLIFWIAILLLPIVLKLI